jgi:hypothetical protein
LPITETGVPTAPSIATIEAGIVAVYAAAAAAACEACGLPVWLKRQCRTVKRRLRRACVVVAIVLVLDDMAERKGDSCVAFTAAVDVVLKSLPIVQ